MVMNPFQRRDRVRVTGEAWTRIVGQAGTVLSVDGAHVLVRVDGGHAYNILYRHLAPLPGLR